MDIPPDPEEGSKPRVPKPETEGDDDGADKEGTATVGVTAGRAKAKEDGAMGEGSEVEATGGGTSTFGVGAEGTARRAMMERNRASSSGETKAGEDIVFTPGTGAAVSRLRRRINRLNNLSEYYLV